MFQDVHEVKTAAVSDNVNAFFYNISQAVSVGQFKTVKSELNRSFNPDDERFSASIIKEIPENVADACRDYTKAAEAFDFKEHEDRHGHYILSISYLNNIATALKESKMTDQENNIRLASIVADIKGSDPAGPSDTNNYLKTSISEITGKPVLVWAQVNGPVERPYTP